MKQECWMDRVDYCIPSYSIQNPLYEILLKTNPESLKDRFVLGDMIILCKSRDGGLTPLIYIEYGSPEDYERYTRMLEEKGLECRREVIKSKDGKYIDKHVSICVGKERCVKYVLTHLRHAKQRNK